MYLFEGAWLYIHHFTGRNAIKFSFATMRPSSGNNSKLGSVSAGRSKYPSCRLTATQIAILKWVYFVSRVRKGLFGTRTADRMLLTWPIKSRNADPSAYDSSVVEGGGSIAKVSGDFYIVYECDSKYLYGFVKNYLAWSAVWMPNAPCMLNHWMCWPHLLRIGLCITWSLRRFLSKGPFCSAI